MCVFDLFVKWRHASSSVACGSPDLGEGESSSRFGFRRKSSFSKLTICKISRNVGFRYGRIARFPDMYVSDTNDLGVFPKSRLPIQK